MCRTIAVLSTLAVAFVGAPLHAQDVKPPAQMDRITRLNPEAQAAIARVRQLLQLIQPKVVELSSNSDRIGQLESSLASPRLRGNAELQKQYVAELDKLVRRDLQLYGGLADDFEEIHHELDRTIDALPIPAEDLAGLIQDLDDGIYGIRDNYDPDFGEGDCLSYFDPGNCNAGMCTDCCDAQHPGEATEDVLLRSHCKGQCSYRRHECELEHCIANIPEPDCSEPDCSDPNMSDIECHSLRQRAAAQCHAEEQRYLFAYANCVRRWHEWLRQHAMQGITR